MTTKIHDTVLKEQLLKRLSHHKAIIKRDYLNYIRAYTSAQVQDMHSDTHGHKILQNTSTHMYSNSTTRRQPVKFKWVYIGSKSPTILEYSWPREDREKVSTKEKTIQDPSYTAAEDPKAQRNPGQMSLSHTNIEKHTHIHKPISQLHTDETPTARHSVMTHAIIAFPPVVSDNTGNSGVHHHHTAAAGLEESSLKRLMMTNTTAEIDSTLTPQWAPSIHWWKSEMSTQWRACV